MRASSSLIASILKFYIISEGESSAGSGRSSRASVSLELTGDYSKRPTLERDYDDTIASV